jgi:hypothetical protein
MCILALTTFFFANLIFRLSGQQVPPRIIFSKLISGGQTGADQGALDAALELGHPCGGWCPKGRKCVFHGKMAND